MSKQSSSPITFVVPGQSQSEGGATRGARSDVTRRLPGGFEGGRIKHSVTLRATRSAGPDVRVDALPGVDVVVMEIAGGPTLVLHPETAQDLLSAQVRPQARSSGGDSAGVPVPLRLQWSGLDDSAATRATRGWFGDVLVKAFHVVTDVFKGKAADFTAEKIAERMDGQVADRVYALDAMALPALKANGTPLDRLPSSSVNGPALVLVHGTFSTTQGTFQKLWAKHPGHVARLFEHYGNRVYALDHSTLGVSPIENALTLVEALRPDTRLHLVTHSRGGLVAEVLAKVCAGVGVEKRDLAPFKGKDYESQLAALRQLASLAKERRIVVERVVRVACPARGTLLASKRLDAYVSVLKWSLELAGIPVVPTLVDFLGAVAQRRGDPLILPGLAAQVPDSPLVQWLHASGADVSGDLRVLAGDLAGDSVTSWLKTLLSDAFYWTDNDLVVQTRAMYGGSPRAGGATFLLDQGGQVSHFNYFANERSADAVVHALTKDVPQGFSEIGALSWAGQSSTGVRGGPAGADAPTSAADQPAVILIPDVLGSHLRIGEDRIWLSRRSANEFARLAYDGEESDDVEPDGVLEPLYAELSHHLARTHEVIPFAYDWRRPIEEQSTRLAEVVDRALAARDRKDPPPVRIIGHGMGGLVARAMQLVRRDVWSRMLARDGARVLFLGTPNEGSWTPMQVLSGDETFGGLLQGIGAPFQDQETRQVMGSFPGFMQLQAGLTNATLSLNRVGTWKRLADADVAGVRDRSRWHAASEQVDIYRWGIPSAAALEQAVAFRNRLDEQTQSGFAAHADRLLTVVGTSRATPDGFENGRGPFVYRDVSGGGDGYVTVASAMLPGVRAWAVDSEHRSLTTNKDAFDVYAELLERGDTRRLPRPVVAGGARGATPAVTHERSRPSRRPSAPSPARMRDPFASATWGATRAGTSGPALSITVTNGNLKFIDQPLMLGHYRSLALSGTEYVMDELIGGTMSQLVALRQYPDRPGSHKVFVNKSVNRENPLQMPRPEAVIIVGLGEEGELKISELIGTVSQGVIAWAQRLAERPAGAPVQFRLAATLIGSGGVGISAGQSALAVAQGVREANTRLIESGWPSVGELELIELYLDRASEAWRALQVQATTSSGEYRVSEMVREGVGGLRRPLDSSYRGANYDFISAVTQRDARGHRSIDYRLDTKRARTEVHASLLQGQLLSELVLAASNDRNTDTQIGRTLFQLLIPPEVEPFLGGTTSVVLEVDSGSAGIPWELLDSAAGTRNGADARPWAIRTKLLRKLRTEDFRAQVMDADAEAHVLIIGDPKCDSTRYPRLDAAREEARAVFRKFIGSPTEGARTSRALPPERVKALIAEDADGADARTIMNAVLERDWRIVHIAAHGEPPEKLGPAPVKAGDPPQLDGDPRGVVLSNGTFLGPREINKMRVVPELVFVNCCHLAARNIGQLLEQNAGSRYDRASFAAGVAESLIRIGVRCVIAAGWAVDDEAARAFAQTFYDRLLAGDRFIDAVAAARIAAYALGGNTWAAYQCYGDPDWTFRWATGDAQEATATAGAVGRTSGTAASSSDTSATTPDVGSEFWAVASEQSLILALDTIATRSKYDRRSPNEQQAKIRYLEGRFATRWGKRGQVAEAFARAWAEVGNRPAAITWYRRAVNASDGSASIRAVEQLGNLRARTALARVADAQRRVEELARGRTRASAAERSDLSKALTNELARARTEVASAGAALETLARRQPSTERLSLCGSAWKRRAIIERIAGDADAETAALREMKSWYRRAEALALEKKDPDVFYPALNRMTAELILNAGNDAWSGFEPGDLDTVRTSLETKTREDPDFWSVVGKTELQLYEALARRDLAMTREAIEREYHDLWKRVDAPSYWDSVTTQLEFVLPKYAEGASKPERAAASALMDHVRQLRSVLSPRG
jgi:pimeloyl-ACP methyl ester carboxylesterase